MTTQTHRAAPSERPQGGASPAGIRANPLRVCFVLAFGITWGVEVIVFALLGFPQVLGVVVTGFGPPAAGVAVIHLTEGKAGLSVLARGLTRWRVGMRW